MLKITCKGDNADVLLQGFSEKIGKNVSSVDYKSGTSGLRQGERRAYERIRKGRIVDVIISFTDNSYFSGHIQKVRQFRSSECNMHLYGDFQNLAQGDSNQIKEQSQADIETARQGEDNPKTPAEVSSWENKIKFLKGLGE